MFPWIAERENETELTPQLSVQVFVMLHEPIWHGQIGHTRTNMTS